LARPRRIGFGFEADRAARRGQTSLRAQTAITRVTSSQNCRLKKSAPERVAVSAKKHFGAFFLRVANVAFHFFYRGVVNQRALRASASRPNAGFIL